MHHQPLLTRIKRKHVKHWTCVVDAMPAFEKGALSEVEKIKAVALKLLWVLTTIDLITDQLQEVTSQGFDVHLAPAKLTKESVVSALAAHCGTTLEFKPWKTDMNLVPIRVAHAGTSNVQMSIELLALIIVPILF